jgi:hypothetical protein
MKKLALIIIGFVFPALAFATIKTVSNIPSTLAQFNDIQAAIDACATGDTVYVYGSPVTYERFVISDKRITVIGPGWSPDKELPLTANVNGGGIHNSNGSSGADGSEIQGLVFTSAFSSSLITGPTSTGVNNVRIIRCQFSNALDFSLSCSNILVEGCIFYYTFGANNSLTYQNFLVQNNLFFFAKCCTSTKIFGFRNTVNIRFDHNVFTSDNNGAGYNILTFSDCRFLTITNNIFNQSNAGENLSFSAFTNNITNNAGLSATNAVSNATPWNVNSNVDGGGNISNQSPLMVDQSGFDAGNSSPLSNYTITSGPANNSGSDGKDMGLLFDTLGSLNWTNSRNGRIPRIYSMNITTPTIPQGGSLTVKVEARKSN